MIHLDVSAVPNVEVVAKKEGYVEQFPTKFGSWWILLRRTFRPNTSTQLRPQTSEKPNVCHKKYTLED